MLKFSWVCLKVLCGVCVSGGGESKKGHPRHTSNWNYLKSLYLNVFPSRNITLKMAFLPKYMGLQPLTTLDFNIYTNYTNKWKYMVFKYTKMNAPAVFKHIFFHL